MKPVILAGIRLLARRWPRAGVALAHALAALTRPLGHGIAASELERAFPGLDPAALPAVRQRTWSGFLKDEAVEAAVRRPAGPRSYPRVVPNPAVDALRAPMILATFHVGPIQALGAVLHGLPGEVLAVTRDRYSLGGDVTVVPEGESLSERALTFHRALTALRSGSFVLATLDALGPHEDDLATFDVPLLGRTLAVPRGPAALARASRTPIVPLVARWRGTAVEVTVGDAIPPSTEERDMATAAGRWIERYLTERPGEVSAFLLGHLRPAGGR